MPAAAEKKPTKSNMEKRRSGGRPQRPSIDDDDVESGKRTPSKAYKEKEAMALTEDTTHTGTTCTGSFSISRDGSDNDVRSKASRSRDSLSGTISVGGVSVPVDSKIIKLVSEVQQYNGDLESHDGDSDDESNRGQRRKGDLCCGSCCDLRKAVIIVDSIYAFLNTVLIFISVFNVPFNNVRLNLDRSFEENEDEIDVVGYGYGASTYVSDEIQIDGWGYVLLSLCTVTILVAGMGILGAVRFNKSLVLATGIWYSLYGLVAIYDRRFVGMFMAFFFSYPQFHLFFMLKADKITSDNYYDRERYCCCGSGRKR